MIEDGILKNRQSNFNKNIATAFTQRAENHKLSLRKDTIDNYIEQKRMKYFENEDIVIENVRDLSPEKIIDMKNLNLNRELSFAEIIENLKVLMMERSDWYADTQTLKECLVNIRKITCRHLVRDNNVLLEHKIPSLIFSILEYYQSEVEYSEIEQVILKEALWSINNLACVNQSKIFDEIKSRNILSVLKNYLYCDYDKLITDAAHCIGNIVIESRDFRNKALKLGILDRVVKLSQDMTKPLELTKNCMFLILTILRGKPHPDLEKIGPSLNIVSANLWSNDEEIVKSSLQSISYLSDGIDTIQSKIISTGCIPKILQYAVVKKKEIQTPSLRIIGNLAGTTNNKLCELLLDSGVPKVIIDLFNSPQSVDLIKELLWIFSNLSLGSIKVVNYLAENEKFIKRLSVLLMEDDALVRFQALSILYNLLQNGNIGTVERVIRSGIVNHVCKLLTEFFEMMPFQTSIIGIGFLNRLIKLAKKNTELVSIILSSGLREKFESVFLNTQFQDKAAEASIEKFLENINKLVDIDDNVSMTSYND